ncbi:hypothetical protein BpHYR1_001738 [Brachionus plicatilis]|uniref:Uncharacterized protein n=1 Tax=Brachionus plicatilis TaxID=10195 RepID=A0A3M7QGN4_BRAPC|nr:hypothetical protein BpHYR1_001738 [Brachionus plicatilis]
MGDLEKVINKYLKEYLFSMRGKISNRLFELSERYVKAGLSHSVPPVFRVGRIREGFESRYIEYPTPLFISTYRALARSMNE